MKRNYSNYWYATTVILLAIIVGLGVTNLFAQNQQKTDEGKKVKKMEKKIEVSEVNGEKTVKITEREDGKETVQVLTGDEAEEYLNREGGKTKKIVIMGESDLSELQLELDDLSVEIEQMMEGMKGEDFLDKMDSAMKEMDVESHVMELITELGEASICDVMTMKKEVKTFTSDENEKEVKKVLKDLGMEFEEGKSTKIIVIQEKK